jgi:Enoyl-(Acyl carrier protein) reductase
MQASAPSNRSTQQRPMGLPAGQLKGFEEAIVAKSLLKRWGTSDEVARAARFLLSEDSSNITGHGADHRRRRSTELTASELPTEWRNERLYRLWRKAVNPARQQESSLRSPLSLPVCLAAVMGFPCIGFL